MRKSIKKNKKALLMAAVLSALEVGSVVGNVGLPMTNVAEAATALTEEERIARGYPKIPNLTYYDDGTVLLRDVKHYTYEGDSGSIYGYNAETRASGKLMSYDNDSAVFLVENADADSFGYGSRTIKQVAYSKGQLVASNTSGEVEKSSLENEDSLKKKEMFKSMLNEGYSFDQNSASGFVVISPDNSGANPKTVLKKEGVDIEEGTVTISKEMNTKDITTDGKITTTGDIETGGDIHDKGDMDVDGKATLHGDTIIEGSVTTYGDTTIDGKTTLKGDTTIGDGAEDRIIVEGTAEFKERTQFNKDVTVKGKQTIEQNLHVKGDSVTEGNSTVEGDAAVKGSITLGDDKNADVLEVNAKTNIHGNTTIGDSSDDKFTVNATSKFKSDTTFDQNVLVKGDQTVEGNSHTKGNAEVDKDLAVHGSDVIDGDSVVHGDSTVDGKFHAKSNAEFDQNVTIHGSETVDGDSHVKGNIEVDKDMTVHGAMVVDGGMKVSDDFGTKGNMTVDKTLTVGGGANISGDTILDGKFFAKGAAAFGDSMDVAKNLTVGGNAHVIGDSVVDGDSYARSYNIGNEKYIDSNGINANNHKIRNVADGEIGPNSLDAVNGRQLWHTREALQHNLNQVGAGAAAMASLHPLDYEHDDKLSVSAAMGNYKDKTAMAVGAFYRPNIKSMINLSGTLGYGDNMFGIGVTTKMGKVTEADTMTDEQLRDKVSEIHDENKELREENSNLKSEVSDLKEKIAKFNKQDTAQEKQIAALTAKNADIEKAYIQLISKVDGMAAELASLKADSQK
ncbi:MAG: hypothetical protein E7203_09155 [Selenomonas ruminantium]|uniref:Coiled stalk of trimeric autotransporter adhesin n=1 Tax=Selenomonas ruminantium TaxID=971 RepID=A0A927WJH4_SELRU|nr:YadA-like family protein [Selenomonas ruminantium]MBE6085595.1 hypothetical protein [Selenomonas ruminantium]